MEHIGVHSIETGGYSIIDSGSIILYDKSASAIFSVTVDETFTFHLEIIFSDEKNDEKRYINRKVDEKKDYIKFECINFDNPLGTGTTIPIKIAKHQGKVVCMHLWSFLLGSKGEKGTRKLEYSFYIAKEVEEQEENEGKL